MPVLGDILNVVLGSMRVGGLIAAMPAFGTGSIPVFVKAALALTFGVCLTAYLRPLPEGIFYHNEILVGIVAREIGIGIFIGICARLIFAVVSMGIEYASIQMGFSMANIFDPTNFSQVTVLGQVGSILSILTFFTLDMHHDLFLVVAKSYSWLPVAYPDFQTETLANIFIGFVQTTFVLSLKLSMPVLVVMLIIHTILGIIAKTAPQMNLFFNVAISLNVVVGVMFIYFMMPHFLKGIVVMGNIVTGGLGL